ncbi:MAG TPA: FAD-dependent oxidoreductase [Coleofasciculaceae cyanobacterium]|jgi:monoamine oxidase
MNIETILNYCQLANQGESKKVTILGAGIAGLVAAYELEKLGHQVEIFEGSSRIGGRIWTHRFGDEPDAPYGELGAMRIPKEHQHTLHYVREMGLEDKLSKFTTIFEEQNALMNIQNQVFRMKDAPRIFAERYQTSLFAKDYSEKTCLFAAWLKTIVDAIAPGDLRASFDQDLESHLMDDLEKLDLEPFVNENGDKIDLRSFIKANPSFRAACSKDLDMFLSDISVETSQDLLQLEGGMDQLIHRLVAAIKAPIKYNRKVVALDVKENSVKVSWTENGKVKTRNCDNVVCTIPFSILKKIKLSGFDEQKLASIGNTVYCPATKVAFHCAESFWEKEGIKGGASFTGEGIRQTYYPSVKFNPSQGSALLASYTIGDDAVRLGNMLEKQRYSYVQDVVSQIHPEINTSGMVVDGATMAWGNYEWGGGGCTVPWGGDNSNGFDRELNYLEAARPQNQLFFAGEHCSKYHAWIQGSIESALEAVYELVAHQPVVQIKNTTLIPLECEVACNVPLAA